MSPAIPILMYHIVDRPRSAEERRVCSRPEEFAAQMSFLAQAGWQVVSLSKAADALLGHGPRLERAVVVTFDDGTACTHEFALPTLVRHGFCATVFMVSGLIGGRNEWACQRGQPERQMLTRQQLRELVDAGIEVGSHTVTHRKLAGQPAAVVGQELRESRQGLEDLLGREVRHFAYPYGSLDSPAIAAVRAAGYATACSTCMGRNRYGAIDPFALRRTEIRGEDAMWQFRLKLRFGTHDMPPWSVPRATARKLLSQAGLVRSPLAP